MLLWLLAAAWADPAAVPDDVPVVLALVQAPLPRAVHVLRSDTVAKVTQLDIEDDQAARVDLLFGDASYLCVDRLIRVDTKGAPPWRVRASSCVRRGAPDEGYVRVTTWTRRKMAMVADVIACPDAELTGRLTDVTVVAADTPFPVGPTGLVAVCTDAPVAKPTEGRRPLLPNPSL